MNVQGLALTCIKEAVKSTKLGLVLCDYSDAQIEAIWQFIFGHPANVRRTDLTLTVSYGGQDMTFLTAVQHFREVMKIRSNPELFKQLLQPQNQQLETVPQQVKEEDVHVLDETDEAFDKIIGK